MKKLLFLTCIILLLNIYYIQPATNMLTSRDYDSKEDKTDYLYFPYGDIALPGKWVETTYNSSSRQQFFINQDSVSIAISFGPCNKVEFNADGNKKGFEFLEMFYNWSLNILLKYINY